MRRVAYAVRTEPTWCLRGRTAPDDSARVRFAIFTAAGLGLGSVEADALIVSAGDGAIETSGFPAGLIWCVDSVAPLNSSRAPPSLQTLDQTPRTTQVKNPAAAASPAKRSEPFKVDLVGGRTT